MTCSFPLTTLSINVHINTRRSGDSLHPHNTKLSSPTEHSSIATTNILPLQRSRLQPQSQPFNHPPGSLSSPPCLNLPTLSCHSSRTSATGSSHITAALGPRESSKARLMQLPYRQTPSRLHCPIYFGLRLAYYSHLRQAGYRYHSNLVQFPFAGLTTCGKSILGTEGKLTIHLVQSSVSSVNSVRRSPPVARPLSPSSLLRCICLDCHSSLSHHSSNEVRSGELSGTYQPIPEA